MMGLQSAIRGKMPRESDGVRSPLLVYDRSGRLKYHSDFHARHKAPWTNHEEKYLIDNYEKDGPEAVSMALERTIGVIMTRAWVLRTSGKMPKRTSTTTHKRIKPINRGEC